MSDNPNKKDLRDRNRIASDQEHEVQYFAARTGLSRSQVLAPIDKHGTDRETLEREARAFSS